MLKNFFLKILCLVVLGWYPPLAGQSYINDVSLEVGGGTWGDILVTDSSYIVSTKSNIDWRLMQFAEFDHQGQLLNKKEHLFDSFVQIANCPKCLNYKNNRFYSAHTLFVKSDSLLVVFHKLSPSFDTLRSQKHIDFEGHRPQILAMEFDTDSSFIATGYVFRWAPRNVTYKYDLWVARFDTAFNVLWEKRFEDNHPNLLRGYMGTDIELDAYGSVIVSGEGRNHNGIIGNIQLWYGFAARLDVETGQLHWLKEFEGPEGSRNVLTLDQGDGTYRFVEGQIVSRTARWSDIDSTQTVMGLIDTTGQVLWDKVIAGPIWKEFQIQDFYPTTDGNYYAAGQHYVPPGFTSFPPYYGSAAFKFSPQGDSIWYRHYHYQDSADISHIWSFKPTPDSGFVHIGTWSDFHNTQEQFTHTWFLKTDQYGCDTAGCHTVNLAEHPVPVSFLVYPNPTRGYFYVEQPEARELHLALYDLQGRILQKFEAREARVRFEVSKNIPPGLYLLKDRQSQVSVKLRIVKN